MPDFIFSKIPCFQHILLNTFRQMCLKCKNYSLRDVLFLTFKQLFRLQSLIAKTFDGNIFKMKLQVLFRLFLVVSWSDASFDFDHPFFACSIGRLSKIARRKSWAPRKKFVHTWLSQRMKMKMPWALRFYLYFSLGQVWWFYSCVNPFSPGKIEKFDFWDANNCTNFKRQ